MKKILLTSLASLAFLLGYSQSEEQILKYHEDEKVYKYEEVMPYDSTANSDIYRRVLSYVKQNLKPNNGTLLENSGTKDQISMTGNVALKDITTFVDPIYSPVMEYNLNIYFKSGRIKVIIDKILIQGLNINKQPTNILDYNTLPNKDSKNIKKYKSQPNEFVAKVATDLKNILSGKEKKDDW